jgi:hypothetical protein
MTAIDEPRVLERHEELAPAQEVHPDEPTRPHWLATGLLLSGALWAVLIAGITALAGWRHAGYLLALAAVLVGMWGLLSLRRPDRP